MTMNVTSQDIRMIRTEALIVGCYEDVRPLKGLAGELDWLMCGALSRLVLNGKLRGSLGDIALLTPQGKVHAAKIFLIGLGAQQGMTAAALETAVRNAITGAVNAGVKQAAMECFPVPCLSGDPAAMLALVKGATEGLGARPLDLSLLAPDRASCERISRIVNN